MAVAASLGEQQSAEGISRRGCCYRFRRPRHIGGNSIGRIIARLEQQRTRGQSNEESQPQSCRGGETWKEIYVTVLHRFLFLPVVRRGTGRAERLSIRIAWRNVLRR